MTEADKDKDPEADIKSDSKEEEAAEAKEVVTKEPGATAEDEVVTEDKGATAEDKGATAEDKSASEDKVAVAAEDKSASDRPNSRSSLTTGFFKTLEYVSEASGNKAITYRDSDRRTTNFLGIALIGAVIFAALPSLQMPSLALICYVVADIFLLLAIGGFVLTRFGVIRAMEPRYALVTWHLMVGTGLLTLTLGFNIVAIAVIILMRDKVGSLLGTPLF